MGGKSLLGTRREFVDYCGSDLLILYGLEVNMLMILLKEMRNSGSDHRPCCMRTFFLYLC